MLTSDELRALWTELENPKSWHWHRDEPGFIRKVFTRIPTDLDTIEGVRIHQILQQLDNEAKTSEHASAQARAIRDELKMLQERFFHDGHIDTANTISKLFSNDGITVTSEGSYFDVPSFSVVDIPIEYYIKKSFWDVNLPRANNHCFSQGAVLQSAREAARYRLETKSSLKFSYSTRTLCMYIHDEEGKYGCVNELGIWIKGNTKESIKGLKVAFDDDPINNIILSGAQEGYEEHRNGRKWIITLTDGTKNAKLVEEALNRAQKNKRVITILEDNWRTKRNFLAIAKCILGDVARKYAKYIDAHSKKSLCCYTLHKNSCFDVHPGNVLLHCVSLGIRGDDGIIDTGYHSYSTNGAQGVRIIFSSRTNKLEPYIIEKGIYLCKKYGVTLEENAIAKILENTTKDLSMNEQVNVIFAGLKVCHEKNILQENNLEQCLPPLIKYVTAMRESAPKDDECYFGTEGFESIFTSGSFTPEADITALVNTFTALGIQMTKPWTEWEFD